MLSIIKKMKPKKIKLKEAYVIDKVKFLNGCNYEAKVKLKKVKNQKALLFKVSEGERYIFILGDNIVYPMTAHMNYRKKPRSKNKKVLLLVEKLNGVYRPVFNFMRYNYNEVEKELVIVSHFADKINVKLFK